MPIGVFQDRLQDHRRDQSVVQFRLHPNLLGDAPPKTPVLHGHVHFVELHLVAEWYQLRFASFQTDTQQTAELFKHQICCRHIRVHQTGNAIQSVEKKMGIEVCVHCLKPRLGQLNLELRCCCLLLSEPLVVANSPEEEECAPEDH